MEILVGIIQNQPIDSNCFVVYNDLNSSCIIIDPGTEDCNELLLFLEKKNLVPEYIILTHEHFDHIWGVNKLLELFDCKVVCAEKCLESIINKKKNLSIFYNQIGFEIPMTNNVLIVSDEVLNLGKYSVQFKETPGHSQGSISFWINEMLFVGDVFIKDTKTVTKLPSGSKKELSETIYALKELFSNRNIVVYPGHGEVFYFDNIDFSKII
ncbi:MBL fold metallo-hydrolase [Flavobacterium sp. PS2]|jgi:glyoxylase-like metal-dependent hydrolase (beta-lactamase superfamily II)|uniref:MBL fold metallo-hydrolase n=1 Tax=Flavobacterium sp. PS2 TaxID=3384157 RepID=UPI00390CD905